MTQHSSAGTETKPKNGLKPHTSVWGRLLICQCGNHFNAHYHTRSDRTPGVDYQCYTAINRGSVLQRAKKGLSIDDSCDSPFISGWKLDMMAKKIFQDYIKDGSGVLELAYSMLEKHLNDPASGSSDTTEIIRQKQTEIDKLKKKLSNLIEMREDGDIDKQTFRARKEELEGKTAALTDEIQKLSAASPTAVQEDYSARLATMKEKLKTYMDFSAPVIPEHIVEAFIEKILVSKDEFRWYLRIGNADINSRIKLVDFTIPLEEAKKYLYSISPKRRVLRYTDLHVSVWL